MTCTAAYSDRAFQVRCSRQADEAGDHDGLHHDPDAHLDWQLDCTERRPYQCTWARTGYADGIVAINRDQPPCPVCEPASQVTA